MADDYIGKMVVNDGVTTELVNLYPKNGEIHRSEAKINAVVIQYVEGVDYDGNRVLYPVVHVECVDGHMEQELVEKAREIIEKL